VTPGERGKKEKKDSRLFGPASDGEKKRKRTASFPLRSKEGGG